MSKTTFEKFNCKHRKTLKGILYKCKQAVPTDALIMHPIVTPFRSASNRSRCTFESVDYYAFNQILSSFLRSHPISFPFDNKKIIYFFSIFFNLLNLLYSKTTKTNQNRHFRLVSTVSTLTFWLHKTKQHNKVKATLVVAISTFKGVVARDSRCAWVKFLSILKPKPNRKSSVDELCKQKNVNLIESWLYFLKQKQSWKLG